MSAKILIVEDEILVARDLERQIKALGYDVAGITDSGEEAIRLARQTHPDLVLMDIRLQGAIDGVAAAEEIHKTLFLPVVYLTAHADDATVHRARITEPFGYLIKPFEERELTITLEMALYKHQAERKTREALQALEFSEARFQTFMDNSPVIAFIKDEEGRYVYVNRNWHQMFKEPVKDWQGKTDFDFWPEEMARVFRASDLQVLHEGRPFEIQESGKFPVGDFRHWIVHKFPLQGPHGEPLVGGMIMDITRQKEMEEQLFQAQKMESIGRLAGGVAHDFNNMLTAINGNASLLLRTMPADHPWSEFINDILRAGERAAELTRQLLAFSRKQMLQPQILDLNQVVSTMQKMLSRMLTPHIELITHLQPGLGPVRADPGQLEQVVLNLVINARDAMPEGGKLCIDTAEFVLDEAAGPNYPGLRPGPYRTLRVTDTGHGIEESIKERIFEPFFTTKDIGKGTGMGLAMVYGIVKQSNGHIVVDSKVGQGSTFTVFLPGVAEPVAPVRVRSEDNALPGGRETVLVVEDEATVRGLMRRILQLCGYVVLEAHHGLEALAFCERYSGTIDLLVTDLAMPHMSGKELASQLCQQRPAIKVLFVSGFSGEVLRDKNDPWSQEPVLQKPFLPTALARRVRDLLDRKPNP